MIPVVPIALGSPGPRFPPPQRASDADRDTAVDILCAAVADGRLALSELDERVAAALSARTLTELAALIADLLSREPPLSCAGDPSAIGVGSQRAEDDRQASADRADGSERAGGERQASADPGEGPQRAGGDRQACEDRWSLLQSLAAG